MSEKIIKITNGKILNYSIAADGYKTIRGSQMITADTNINKTMISQLDNDGVYSFGDRIGNCATFVCYFNSTDPSTLVNKTYAVFVLDAAYRDTSKRWGSDYTHTPLPEYANVTAALNAKESATYNTNVILNTYPGNTNYSAFIFANSVSMTLGSETYKGALPNAYELTQIFNAITALDMLDPTATSYSTKTLASLFYVTNGPISSNESNSNQIPGFAYNTALPSNPPFLTLTYKSTSAPVIPVFEIPVE